MSLAPARLLSGRCHPKVIPAAAVAAIREGVLTAARGQPTPGALDHGVLHLPGLINYDQVPEGRGALPLKFTGLTQNLGQLKRLL